MLLLPLALLLSAAAAAQAAPATGQASVTMVSEAGEYVGGGTNRLFAAPQAVFLRGSRNHVRVAVAYRGESFTFDFAAPSGEPLKVGEYTGAERYPFETVESPGLAVSGDGRGCNNDYGRFVVKDIHFAAAGKLDRFWALYEQHCESPAAPALFGEVRVGEPPPAAPEAAVPAAIAWPQTKVGASGVGVPVTIIGGESGAQIAAVGLEGEDASDFSITSDACTAATLAPGGACVITVAVTPTASGLRTAQLLITDKSGAKTTVPLTVPAT